MPSLDLFNPAADADGWHDVRAPGGYEWWYFDAEDAATDTQVVAILMQGFIFHPGYLRAHARFVKHPTITPPPVGADFPCVYLCVYRGGKIWKQFFTQYPREQFRASSACCDVNIGVDNFALRDDEGRFRLGLMGAPWNLTARGPRHDRSQSLGARLTFTTRVAHLSDHPKDRAFLSRSLTGAEHRWSIVAPDCEVEGQITCGTESIDFRGRGYHDHNYGTAPIGAGLARWTWGRAMFGDGVKERRVVTFHHAEPRDDSRPTETHFVEANAHGERDIAVGRVAADWSLLSKPAMMLRYPAVLDFGPALRLSEPRVVDPSPFYLRVTMRAESFGERSTAFCEIAYPHRLRWPLLGRMIEMSFDKRRALSER